ncbi:YjjG family noncanonical pyrimidine nucleotidase [Jeotgalibaca sp. MA1X17-3]|uniref:YjjG family noncanonical pyrimidine nucleotidase n=1 Tax=Jeotgalibaca sp. MA1X17-3 TaxID=2908211 RepID=UPI001F343D08|nr:YjjG family noncanonical pyrimidine nucleotidase [Jeotgalibaca sp. MA1X17-3]UJF15652.1 YjjG family noncanonical pyrimidine nucleotidase [Jeotgalibaca sp. MA1X17-3]
MGYQTLLFDLDDTLLDFKAAEKNALTILLEETGVEPVTENIQQYSKINQRFWNLYEKGKIDRDRLLSQRFEDFFGIHGQNVDGAEMDRRFRSHLEEGHFLIDGCVELLDELKQSFELYAVTNGVSKTQYRRLTDSGLLPYFKNIFVSEDTGYQKPMPEYFDYVFHRIPAFSHSNALIIGDSLTSDITGGNKAGIDSCWFNPEKQENLLNIEPTYQIQRLSELHHILG